MTNEPAPFLTAESVGKEFVTRDGQTVTVKCELNPGWFAVANGNTVWPVNCFGRRVPDCERCVDLLPSAPQPEQRTVWLNMYKSTTCVNKDQHEADGYAGSGRQGEAVPVNLECGADGNWRVVAELTPKQKAADAMYEALQAISSAAHGLSFGSDWNKGIAAITYGYRDKLIASILPALDALAKAEGRS